MGRYSAEPADATKCAKVIILFNEMEGIVREVADMNELGR
jgi:hypothetical protein